MRCRHPRPNRPISHCFDAIRLMSAIIGRSIPIIARFDKREGSSTCSSSLDSSSLTSLSSHSWSSRHWCAGDMSMPQLWQASTLSWSLEGETLRGGWGGGSRTFSGEGCSLCVFPLWIFRPFSDLNVDSHRSQLKPSPCCFLFLFGVSALATSDGYFLLRYSSLRLAFLLRVEGLFLFLTVVTGASLPSLALASREKVKAEPMVTENLNSNPWRASAWQKSMHWEFREELSSLAAVILANYIWTCRVVTGVRGWSMLKVERNALSCIFICRMV